MSSDLELQVMIGIVEFIGEAESEGLSKEAVKRVVDYVYTRFNKEAPQTSPVEAEQPLDPRPQLTKRWQEAHAIIRDAAAQSPFTVEDILSPCRIHDLVEVRQKAMVEVHTKMPGLSMKEMGRIFKRDHTTVLFALRKSGVWRRKFTRRLPVAA